MWGRHESVERDAERAPERLVTDGGRDALAERVRGLLYAGEEPVATLPVADGLVVATSHRLLVYTPDGDGPNLRVVEGPNVTGVGRDTTGDDRLRRPTALGVGGGLLATLAGLSFDPENPLETTPTDTGGVGIEGLLSPIQGLLDVVTLVDDLLVAVGVLALLGGLVGLAAYLVGRETTVVVAVAGDDDLRVAAGGTTAEELRSFASTAGVDYNPPSFRSS